MPASPLRVANIALARAARYGTAGQQAAARTAFNEAKVHDWTERMLASAPPHLSAKTIATLSRLLAVTEK